MAEDVFDRDFFVKAGRRGAQTTNSKLTDKERQKSARKAALARWRKNDPLGETKRGITNLLIKAKKAERAAKAPRKRRGD
jgi:hypothetical protein